MFSDRLQSLLCKSRSTIGAVKDEAPAKKFVRVNHLEYVKELASVFSDLRLPTGFIAPAPGHRNRQHHTRNPVHGRTPKTAARSVGDVGFGDQPRRHNCNRMSARRTGPGEGWVKGIPLGEYPNGAWSSSTSSSWSWLSLREASNISSSR